MSKNILEISGVDVTEVEGEIVLKLEGIGSAEFLRGTTSYKLPEELAVKLLRKLGGIMGKRLEAANRESAGHVVEGGS